MADNNNQSATADKFEVSSQEATLIMAVMEHMHPNFDVQGWQAIAAKVGLSIATAKQRFAVVKNRYKDINDGVAPPTPTIKKRKRGSARAASNAGTIDGSEAISARPARKRSMAGSRVTVPVLKEEDISDDGDSVPTNRVNKKKSDSPDTDGKSKPTQSPQSTIDDEVRDAAIILMDIKNSKW